MLKYVACGAIASIVVWGLILASRTQFCSNCGTVARASYNGEPYCPNCGDEL